MRLSYERLKEMLRNYCLAHDVPYGHDKGALYIDAAYGGYRVVQVVNESGGIRALGGYVTPRALAGFIAGMDAGGSITR